MRTAELERADTAGTTASGAAAEAAVLAACEAEADRLAALEAVAAQEAALYAVKVDLVHQAVLQSERESAGGAERFLVLDLAGSLRIGQMAASSLVEDAVRLVQVLPGTLAALRKGRVFLAQSRIIVRQTRECTEAVAAEVDRRLHAMHPEGLADWLARRLTDRVRRLVLQVEAELDPQAGQQREADARQGRRVSVRSEPDGMASLWALLPAEQLRVFTLGLDELTRRQRLADRDSGVERTADQRRADVLAALPSWALHAQDAGACSSRRAAETACGHGVTVHVHVPLATALGLSDEPGVLDGYGPISGLHARGLLTTSALDRVVVDDVTGRPLLARAPTGALSPPGTTAGRARAGRADLMPESALDVGPGGASRSELLQTVLLQRALVQEPGLDGPEGPERDTDRQARARLRELLLHEPVRREDLQDPDEGAHQASERLAAFVRMRDPLCSGPGCSCASSRSDLDHVIAWPQGPTTAANLDAKSRRCHRAKTFTWTVTRSPDGTSRWHSPTGRSYTVPPYWSAPPTPRVRPRAATAGGRSSPSAWAAAGGATAGTSTSATGAPETDTELTADLDDHLHVRLQAEADAALREGPSPAHRRVPRPPPSASTGGTGTSSVLVPDGDLPF